MRTFGPLGWLGGNEGTKGNFGASLVPAESSGMRRMSVLGRQGWVRQGDLCPLTGCKCSPVTLERGGNNQRNNLNWSTQTKSALLECITLPCFKNFLVFTYKEQTFRGLLPLTTFCSDRDLQKHLPRDLSLENVILFTPGLFHTLCICCSAGGRTFPEEASSVYSLPSGLIFKAFPW